MPGLRLRPRFTRWLRGLAGLLVLLAAAGTSGAADSGVDWSGAWHMQWRGTGGRVVLEQEGDRIAGRYPLYDAVIDATVVPGGRGDRIEGRWSAGGREGRFIAVLSRDGKSFAGRFDDGEWWTGSRLERPRLARKFALATPRETLTAFVVAGNLAESGIDDAWMIAIDAVDFGAPDAAAGRSRQLLKVRQLFELVALTTFRYWAIPEPPAGADSLVVRLEQQPSGVLLPLTLRKNAQGIWQIVYPGEDEIRELRRALLAAYGGKLPPADAYTKLQNPRDTMLAFLRGMADWDGHGRALAMSTLDLSAMPEIVRKNDGEVAAQYLRRVLDHIGLVGLQGIPNDGSSRLPYVHFAQGDKVVAIAPSGPGPDAPWKFTPQTVADIRDLYLVTERLPPPVAAPPWLIPRSTFFELRALVADHAPFLLHGVGRTELWQVLIALCVVAVAVAVGRVLARAVCRALERLPGVEPLGRPFRWSIVVMTVIALVFNVPHLVGLAGSFREVTMPVWGVLGCVAIAIVAWQLLAVLNNLLDELAERSTSAADDILVTLVLAAARLGVVVGCGLGISYFLSIPTTNLLAGLGIGGLALAFASRETLANVFGAGILVTDRPFRRGDWIKTGQIEGAVESVGVRSTRLRTAQDSVVFIPNGKLVDSLIDNLGTRRFRLLKLQLPVTSGGTPERLESFVAAVRDRICSDPVFGAEQTTVGLSNVGKDGIFVDVGTSVDVTTDAAEDAARSALLLDTVKLAERAGLVLGNGMVKPNT